MSIIASPTYLSMVAPYFKSYLRHLGQVIVKQDESRLSNSILSVISVNAARSEKNTVNFLRSHFISCAPTKIDL